MPWTVADVERHNKGLPEEKKAQWVSVANSALSRCQKKGGSNCEAQAIRMANGVVSKESHMEISRKAIWTTAFINNLPDSSFLYVEPGGSKDGEGKTTPRSKRHFPYKGPSGAIDLPHLRNAVARIPQSNAPGLNKAALQARARKLLGATHKDRLARLADAKATYTSPNPKKTRALRAQGMAAGQAGEMGMEEANPEGQPSQKPKKQKPKRSLKSELIVMKQSDGTYRWVMFTSNPYLDRDKEYVTQKAHEADIEQLDTDGNYGPLRWWHVGEPYFEKDGDWRSIQAGAGADLGTCDFVAMHDRIRVESGTFRSIKIGQAVAQNASRLEGSLGFAHPSSEPDKGGGFLNIKSFERSLTPVGKASNIFTTLLVSHKGNDMDAEKLKALKDLGIDIGDVLENAENVQSKADKTTTYRLKAGEVATAAEADDDDNDLASKLDRLTAQIQTLQSSMKESGTDDEPEEKLEDLMVAELTVGELQDVISEAISVKSAAPIGTAIKLVLEELTEIKSLLTSKSVQSVVDEVARMKAKLERQSARLKATASKVRDLDDERPRAMGRGIRPSQSDDTLLLDDDEDLSQKSSTNPFSWLDTFIEQK